MRANQINEIMGGKMRKKLIIQVVLCLHQQWVCKPHIYGTLMCGMKEHRSGLSFYKTKQFYPHCYHYHFYHYYLFIII